MEEVRSHSLKSRFKQAILSPERRQKGNLYCGVKPIWSQLNIFCSYTGLYPVQIIQIGNLSS